MIYALIKMILVLLCLLGTLWVLYFFMKKKIGINIYGTGKNRHIAIVERQYLSPKVYLAHVEWVGKTLLLAVTPSGVYLVKETESNIAVIHKEDS